MVSKTEEVFPLFKYGGLNEGFSARDIANEDFSVLENAVFDKGGYIGFRNAFGDFNDATDINPAAGNRRVYYIGTLATNTDDLFLVEGNAVIYLWTRSSAGTWTNRGNFVGEDPTWVHWGGAVYIAAGIFSGSNKRLAKWDGTTLTYIDMNTTNHVNVLEYHKERLFGSYPFNGGPTSGHRLVFSDLGDFTTWALTSFIDVGTSEVGTYAALNCLLDYRDALYCFRLDSVWVLFTVGEPANWQLKELTSEYGAISPWSAVEADGVMYFLDKQGVVASDGNSFQLISEGIGLSNITDRASLEYVKSLGLLVVSTEDGVYSLDVRRGKWSKWATAIELAHPYEDKTPLSNNSFMMGTYTGSLDPPIYKYDDGIQDGDTTHVTLKAESKEFDFGAPHLMKRLKWLVVLASNEVNFDIIYTIDGVEQAAITVTKEGGLVSPVVYKIAGPNAYFSHLKVRIEVTAATAGEQNFKFHGWEFIYELAGNVIQAGT